MSGSSIPEPALPLSSGAGRQSAGSVSSISFPADEITLKDLFRIRTITCFVSLSPDNDQEQVRAYVQQAAHVLTSVEAALANAGYEVQTRRIATNPFGQWLPLYEGPETLTRALQELDADLAAHGIPFCALGPALTPEEVTEFCPLILKASERFYCSATLDANDYPMAHACAEALGAMANTPEGTSLAFRFAVAAYCQPHIPFFPVAKSSNDSEGVIGFAIGLENGRLARHLLQQSATLEKVPTTFRDGIHHAFVALQQVCLDLEQQQAGDVVMVRYLGMDTSLNPSLEEEGSVAGALEQLHPLEAFGGPGTLAATAAVTTSLQSLPGIRTMGYCGVMLPVCEDVRLAKLSLSVADLLAVSSVCGVGLDTIPIGTPSSSSDCSDEEKRKLQRQEADRLAALFLDVAGLAGRWNKPLSCRVLPVPQPPGERTAFEFPHLVNSTVLSLR